MEVLCVFQDAKTVVSFEHCRMSHPRFHFNNFDIPQWLRNYEIARIQWGDNDPMLAKAVCKRYHMVLDNSVDRMLMSKLFLLVKLLQLFVLLPRR